MLRIKHLKSSRSAGSIADYFEHKKARAAEAQASAGYYENKAAPSQWLGQGAEALGLHGAVDRKQLIELLEGRLPDGTDLTQRGGRAAQARRGTDITLSAMKSYSLMATHDPRLVALWDESVKVAATVDRKRGRRRPSWPWGSRVPKNRESGHGRLSARRRPHGRWLRHRVKIT